MKIEKKVTKDGVEITKKDGKGKIIKKIDFKRDGKVTVENPKKNHKK